MRTCRFAAPLVVLLGLVGSASVASAAVDKVISVPWQGDTTKYHTTLSGGGGRLKGVIKTTDTSTHYYKWVYGDGGDSGVLSVSGNTWYTVEDVHAYTGADGTPFTAQLVVADNSGLTGSVSDPYLVKIEANTLDARINVAIDEGLWYTYKQGTRGEGSGLSTFDGSPFVYWTTGGHYTAPTASAVQSFEINGSKESGNFDQDPYAEYVYRGLKFLIMGNSGGTPVLRSLTLSLQHGDDPDSNGNTIGIEAYDLGIGQPIYQGGQVMDALIASGTPSKSSGRDFVGGGTPHVATYAEIIQDMVDMYAWGQYDGACAITAVSQGVTDLTGFGAPLSITLHMLNTQCSGGGTFELLLNGVSLGTIVNDPANGCTCGPSEQLLTISDTSALATAWAASATKTLRVVYSGGGYNSRVYATLDWGSGNSKNVCVRSVSGNCFTTNLCDGYNGAAFDVSLGLADVDTYTTEVRCSGAWIYNWNEGPIDNSSSQWAAIGMIPAQEAPWNAIVPGWVKSYDEAAVNTTHSQQNSGLWGGFGYRNPSGIGPYVADGATSPSGLVQLAFDGVTTSDARWMRTERRFAENWDSGEQWFSTHAKNNLYGMYAFTKAMRLAKPLPVVNFAYNGLDWYRGSVTQEGVAKALSDNLIANNGQYSATYWAGNPLETIWAVIMLKPALFAASPIACFTAHPNPAYSDLPITFDPTCSGHSEPGKGIANLVKFEWDWNNDGTYDESSVSPAETSHAFHCDMVPCAFPVTLRVTDDTGLTATFVQNINITDPPHPPVSRSKAVFWVSQCAGDTLTLDGSASFDPDEGLHQNGCDACPNDTITAWDWDFDGAPFDYTSAHGKKVILGAAYTTTFPTVGSHDIGLKVTDNTLLAFPASGQPNLTDEAFSQVLVFSAGACDLTATPGCDSIHLSWSSTGATTYKVYRSLTGLNADFVEVANTGSATTADIAATFGQNQWFRVKAITGDTETLSKAVFAKIKASDCVCIVNLRSVAKNKLVQLSWSPQAGATGYNVYRSISPNVSITVIPNRIATGIVTGVASYNDTAVVNGTKYYYKVTKIVNGVETCVSNETSATPVLPRR